MKDVRQINENYFKNPRKGLLQHGDLQLHLSQILVLSVGEKPRGKSASSIFCVLLGTTYSSVCWDWGGGECRTLINYSKNSSAVGIIKISHNPNYMAYGREKAL
jgi:hypothetical protein